MKGGDSMDITFKTEQGRFNYRMCAIIIHNEKILAMKDEHAPYYYLPGGRVNLNETAESAVLREVKDEYLYPLFIKKEIYHLPKHLTIITEFE